MIINKKGAVFEHAGIKYVIGETVMGTAESEYEGLFGTIYEICDGEDKETDNETPDFYCSFERPVLPYDVKKLENTFSRLYDEPKNIRDITLDEVIMAPGMVIPLNDEAKSLKCEMFAVAKDWAEHGNGGTKTVFYTDYANAKREMCEMLKEEMRSGIINDFQEKSNFVIDSHEDSYVCYIEGEYMENYYAISLKKETLVVSPEFINRIRNMKEV